MNTLKRPSLPVALTPVLFLVFFLTANVLIFDDTLEGSNQIILLLAAALTSILAWRYSVKWENIQQSIIKSISKALPSILILLCIGSLAGTWLLSGVVPAMVYYGLKIIHPKMFLFTAVIVSGLVSLATGSSWSTIATIGIALLGIGKTLGMHEGLVAGAIISGAYFGDKMSPLSDTTNLAPAVSGADLFTHIRYMIITTGPSILLATVVFFITGLLYDFNAAEFRIHDMMISIKNVFYISPVLLLVPVLLVVIIIKKVPPLPALLAGTLTGGVLAIALQPEIVLNIAENQGNYFVDAYVAIMQAMFGNISIQSEHVVLKDLFETSGMAGMLYTVWLILAAMVFGGSMEAAGFLNCISEAIMRRARSDGSLIMSTIFTSLFFNITASDQYISIVVPGRMYAKAYRERNLKPEVLSRTLEDGGTLTSVLIPWNTCGATQSKILGVSTWTYLPYCFFNLINPLIAIAIAYLNFKIRRGQKKD